MHNLFAPPCETIALSVQDMQRQYLLHVPAETPAKNAGLLVELHGSGLCAEQQLRTSGLYAMAAHHGFIVAAPQAAQAFRLFPDWPEGAAWNVPGVPLPYQEHIAGDGPDESAFVLAMLDDLRQRTGFDPARVYLVGYSGGARMASHLAFALPSRFAAMAVVSGLRNPGIIPAGALPPTIAFHGRRDPFNPFEGGAGARWHTGVKETAQELAVLHGCTRPPVIGRPALDVESWTYKDEHHATRLIQLLHESGHSWPGCKDPEHLQMLGNDNSLLDASQQIYEFFVRLSSCTAR